MRTPWALPIFFFLLAVNMALEQTTPGGTATSATGFTLTTPNVSAACTVLGSRAPVTVLVTSYVTYNANPNPASGSTCDWNFGTPLPGAFDTPAGSSCAPGFPIYTAVAGGIFSERVIVTNGSNSVTSKCPALTVQDFTLSVTPLAATALPGGVVPYTVTASSMNGFTGEIILTQATTLPSDVSAAWSPTSQRCTVPAGGFCSAVYTVTVGVGASATHTGLVFVGTYAPVLTSRSASATLQVAAPFLSFPLHGLTPYTASISSVMDHSIAVDKGNPLFYKLNQLVDAYTGDEGTSNCGLPDCGKKSQGVIGYKNTAGSSFKDNLPNYAGDYWLFYDGHPGYDYPAKLADIYAPGSGIAFIPDCDPVTKSSDCSGPSAGAAVDGYNVLTVDHQNGYSTWYLHMGDMRQVKKEPHLIPAQAPYEIAVVHSGPELFQTDQGVIYTATGLPLKNVTANPVAGEYAVDKKGLYSFSAADSGIAVSITYLYQSADYRVVMCPNQAPVILHRGDGQKVPVTTDCILGKTGNKAPSRILGFHLHFEVRTGLVQNPDGSYQCHLPSCVPKDPYGWTGTPGKDPFPAQFGPNILLWK